jgi:integrase/recombinase XerC
MKLTVLADKYIEHLKAQRKSPYTIKSYSQHLVDFHSVLNQDDLPTRQEVQLLVDEMSKSKSPNTVRSRLVALSSFFDYLNRENLAQGNPARHLVRPKILQALPKAIDYESIVETLNSFEHASTFEEIRNRAIFEFGYAVGARAGDIKSAELANLDLEKRTLKITGKGGVGAVLLFGEKARQALITYLEHRPVTECNKLFVTVDGKELRDIYNIVKRIAGVGPHAFMRHSPATHMLLRGADITVVADFLRHANVSTTQIYTRLNERDKRKKYEAFHPRGA